ncbi:MAG: hypothetical protein JNL21_41810 [Myxococcales bacterium]|nr:hypothetical protein [Myxococcales bacterium]
MGKAGERSAAQRREHPPGWGRATDAAHQDVYFDNAVTSGSQTFEYDAVYRLIRATGREHQSIADVIIGVDGAPIQTLPDPSDPTAIVVHRLSAAQTSSFATAA